MNRRVGHIVLVALIAFYCIKINAQNVTIAEENNLKFQRHFFEALKQKAIKNYSVAIENLEQCYQIDSLNTAVYFELSKNYLLLDKYFESLLFIDKALQNDSLNIHLLQHKSHIYKKQQNFEAAIEVQKQLVTLKPVLADELVLLYLQNGAFAEAKKQIALIEKNALTTRRIKGFKSFINTRLQTTKKPDSSISNPSNNTSIDALKQQFKKTSDFNLLKQLLVKEASQNLFDLLYTDSKEALELFPAQPFIYKMQALALNKLGKYSDAIDVLTIGIDFVIDNIKMEVDFYEQYVISYQGLNNKEQAEKFKLKAAKLRKEI